MSIRQAFLCSFVTVAVVACGIESSVGADWPRFRGPNGTGVSDDKTVPVEFGADKNLLWKVPLPGKGNSSPIVSKGKVFVQASSDDQKQRLLMCLDANKGTVLWSRSFGGGPTKTHPKNTPASNTPAADGDRVYAVFWDGSRQHLTAWDYAGKLLWKRDLGPFRSEHGSGMSPMVAGDKVIVNNDQGDKAAKGPATLQAFHARTGEPAWSRQRDAERACYSTPFLLEKTDAGPDLVVASTGGVTAYDPATGKELWNHAWKFDKARLRTVGSPIEHQGLIFAIAGDGGGDRNMVALKPGTDVAAPAAVWHKSNGTAYVPTPLARDGYLFWIDDKVNVAVCAEARTGNVVWSERLGSDSVTASPVLVDGKVYAISEKGTAYVFPASKSFELLAANDVGDAVYASPAVADGKLYVRGQHTLFCFGKKAE